MHFLVAILFLSSISSVFYGWRALISEEPKIFPEYDWRTESGVLGISGSLGMALAGFIIHRQENVYFFGGPAWPDSHGCVMAMYAIAGITFAMCGLAWFTKTKLAFWVDNRRWPTDEEHKANS